MKTFKEVEIGDYIYYIDHCKLHKQLVTDIINEDIIHEYVDWYGREIREKVHKFIIKAGHGTEIDCSGRWFDKYVTFNDRGMRRFSCLEAAQEYIDDMISWRKERYNKFYNKALAENEIIKKYESNR